MIHLVNSVKAMDKCELEYKTFKVIPNLKDLNFDEEMQKKSSLLNHVIRSVRNDILKIIFMNDTDVFLQDDRGNYFYSNETDLSKLKVGSEFLSLSTRPNILIPCEEIKVSIGDLEKFKDEIENLSWGFKDIDYSNFTEKNFFTKENFEMLINAQKQKQKQSEEEQKRQEEQRQKQIEKEQDEKFKVLEELKDSDTKKILLDNLEIFKNTIKHNDDEFIFEKNIKDIFKIEDIKKFRGWKENIVERLILLKVNFELKGYCKIKFKTKGVSFNGVDIAHNKIKTIMNNLKGKDIQDKTKIALINSLPLMKIDLLKVTELSLRSHIDKLDNIKIPFEIKVADTRGEFFNITLLNKTSKITWDKAKKYFFADGSSRYCDTYFRVEKLNEFFIEDLKGTKQEYLDLLKRLSIIKELQNESN